MAKNGWLTLVNTHGASGECGGWQRLMYASIDLSREIVIQEGLTYKGEIAQIIPWELRGNFYR